MLKHQAAGKLQVPKFTFQRKFNFQNPNRGQPQVCQLPAVDFRDCGIGQTGIDGIEFEGHRAGRIQDMKEEAY